MSDDFDVDAVLAELDDALGSKSTQHKSGALAKAANSSSLPTSSKPSSTISNHNTNYTNNSTTSFSSSNTSSFNSSSTLSKSSFTPSSTSVRSAAPSTRSNAALPSSPKRTTSNNAPLSPSDADLNSLLSSLDDLTSSVPLTAQRVQVKAAPSTSGKCWPVKIGGNDGCPSLSCTSCDHAIIVLPSCKWNESVDYLFFRNSVPSLARLKCGASPSVAHMALCCQCSWQTVSSTHAISLSGADMSSTPSGCSDRSKLRWVCRGH